LRHTFAAAKHKLREKQAKDTLKEDRLKACREAPTGETDGRSSLGGSNSVFVLIIKT